MFFNRSELCRGVHLNIINTNKFKKNFVNVNFVLPHKKEWKIKEQLLCSQGITAVFVKEVEVNGMKIPPSMAEAMLIPRRFPFRKSRCEELARWSKQQGWNVKLRARTLENP